MIAIRNSDGLAIYAGNVTITEDRLIIDGAVDRSLNTSNCTLLDVPAPQPWVGCAYLWDGAEFTMTASAEADYIANKKAQLIAEANGIRKIWQKSGITISGVSIDTDEESISSTTAAIIALEKGAGGNAKFPTTINWRTKSGDFIELSYSALDDIGAAMTHFVEGCFSAEMAHSQAIQALNTLAEVSAYDLSSGWPAKTY